MKYRWNHQGSLQVETTSCCSKGLLKRTESILTLQYNLNKCHAQRKRRLHTYVCTYVCHNFDHQQTQVEISTLLPNSFRGPESRCINTLNQQWSRLCWESNQIIWSIRCICNKQKGIKWKRLTMAIERMLSSTEKPNRYRVFQKKTSRF